MIPLFRSFRDGAARERQRVLWRILMTFSAIKLTVIAAMLTLIGLALTHSVFWFAATPRTTLSMLVSSCSYVILFLQMSVFTASMYSIGPYPLVQAPRAYAIALMNAVASRDTAVGQITPIVPTATGADAGATPGEINPLAHPMRTLGQNNSVYTLGIVAAFLPMAMGVGMLVISFLPSPYYRGAPTPADWFYWLSLPMLLILIAFGGLVWALALRRLARLERQQFSAQVDDEGVTFSLPRGAGGAQRLRWSEARAFARMMTWDDRGGLHEVFVLSDGQRDFAWEARYDTTARDAAQLASEEPARVAAHRLAEVVSQRTALPLFDVTQTIAATLANCGPGGAAAAWAIMLRARNIAKAQGDTALANELTSKMSSGAGSFTAFFVRMGTRLGNAKRLSQTQRDETLRIARALLPYYPAPVEAAAPSAPRPWLQYAYWNLEFGLQLFILLLALANMFAIFALG